VLFFTNDQVSTIEIGIPGQQKSSHKRMFSNVGDQSATIYNLKYCKKEKERKKNSNQGITKENDFILTS